jgi:hypothetical protein
VITSKWKEPPLKPGKQVNSTYWMHVCEDLYSLKADFKEISRRKQRLLNSFEYGNVFAYTFLCMRLIFNILILNSTALIFFTIRIFLFKLGWLKVPDPPIPKKKRTWFKRQKKKRMRTFHVLATALNIDSRTQDQSTSFDTDSLMVICDNSANVHVCNNKNMFLGELRRTSEHCVATIGGNKNVAAGMGTVRWSWKDDNGQLHTKDIQDVL